MRKFQQQRNADAARSHAAGLLLSSVACGGTRRPAGERRRNRAVHDGSGIKPNNILSRLKWFSFLFLFFFHSVTHCHMTELS